MNARIEQLGRILQHSDRMLDCARARRWEDVAALAAERARMLDAYSAMPAAPPGDQPGIAAEAEILASIIGANDTLIALGARHRESLAGELSGNRRQRRAANAYSANAAPPHFTP